MAEADWEAIVDHVAHDNPLAAIELGDTINERGAELPALYRVGRVKGTREMVVHPNYVVVYRVRRDSIEIVRALHSAHRWPPAR
jgi:toxin ParE1/3/4